jgi:hypothetical protein
LKNLWTDGLLEMSITMPTAAAWNTIDPDLR